MPKTKRVLNPLGLWLSNELNRRGILLSDFAARVGTTPQNLSDVMRGNDLSAATMQKWEKQFRDSLHYNESGSKTLQ